ncbi:copper-translocating P-type ATPase [Candidatus Saccharibacteria bacterium]|nr:copper-translocating P-type ATPase [Candidatus Saccharibacteria bacterium]MCB9817573.1 copper-translocating P-type ATPase [Candidatus Nomurabacteria bacterium]HPD98655.1 copper-translocating P-type ATPase [Candidatus Saccharibacteria bacterium]
MDHHEHNHHMNHSEHGGHDKHAGHNPDMFKQKFWLSLLFTLPVLYFSQTIQDLLGYNAISFTGSEYIPAIFGVIIFFYGGLVFLRSAKAEIANRQPGMMTLISLAISVAFVYSSLITLNIVDGMDFWWELASLVTIMLLGHWLEMASVMNAQGALNELAKLLPDEAELVTKSGTKVVSVAELKIGDKVLIRPGSQIPVDGVVTKGESKVNESMLTGESKPVDKSKDSELAAGTVNKSGSLTMKVTKTGDDTALAGIMKLVSEAQSSKSKTQILADRAAAYLFYIALVAAFVTAIGWSFAGESGGYTLERVVAVLIIACPHALGLAIPLVTAISTSKAASAGVIVRERSALELVRNVDVVLFDKTGTLTTGEQGVVEIVADDKKELLAIAAGIEQDSEHPIAKAIVTKAKDMNVKIKSANTFSALEGRGAKAKIGTATFYVGGPRMLKEQKIKLNPKLQKATDKVHENGQTVVYTITGKEVLGAFMIADTIREESKSAVKTLRKAGKKVAIVTGDSKGVASWVADQLGIEDYHAEVLPENKSDVVKNLQKDGMKVAFVGDGVNDAPALTQADVGIAIGAGTDVAIESAGIVLASSDPRGVSRIINLSKATYRKMQQNLVWATGYNVMAIPLAAGALAGIGFVLSPAIGAVLMSLSTIIVAFNAQLLRTKEV